MKSIAIEINEGTQTDGVDENGDFSFYVYASNQCEQDFEEAIETLKLIWDAPTDVSLTINIRLKGVYEDAFEMHSVGGKVIEARSAPLFAAMRKDCQWIIDHIDALETLNEAD